MVARVNSAEGSKLHGHIEYTRARRVLFFLWSGFSLVIFGLIIVQTLNSRFGGEEQVVWSWAIGLLGPNIGLIVTFMIGESQRGKDYIPTGRFVPILILNALYLLGISVLMYAEPFYKVSFFEAMNLASSWLAPISTVVTSSIALLFLSKERSG